MLSLCYRLNLKLSLICLMLLGLSACGGGDQEHMDEFHSDHESQDLVDHYHEFHGDQYSQDLIDHFNEFHGGVDPFGGWVEGEFADATDFVHQCEVPRTGLDPFTGEAYVDTQGSTLNENEFLRAITNNLYLWYDEVEDLNPDNYETPEYFQLLKTTAITDTGAPKDKFHWSVNTNEFYAQSENGELLGYGATFALLSDVPPREVVVVYTLPDTPAAAAGLTRGARILSIDGIDVVDDNTAAGIDILNEGIYPNVTGAMHTFEIQDLGSDTTRTIEMTSAVITETPAPIVSTIATATGNVGYLLFNTHTGLAESVLADAINDLSTQGVSDLVLDIRYNGGGLIDIASELGYMIGGSHTLNKTFEIFSFNDKHPTNDPVTGEAIVPLLFHTTTQGFSGPAGIDLPTLNLDRVFVLTGGNTCSASESLMNGLRGADIEVVQIGATTCGKPYGAYVIDNCGTSYFTIQIKGVNAKGFGDYTDGLFPGATDSSNKAELPGCLVADDYNHLLGDEAEARISAALTYRETGACPVSQVKASSRKLSLPINDGVVRRSHGLGDKILTKGF